MDTQLQEKCSTFKQFLGFKPFARIGNTKPSKPAGPKESKKPNWFLPEKPEFRILGQIKPIKPKKPSGPIKPRKPKKPIKPQKTV